MSAMLDSTFDQSLCFGSLLYLLNHNSDASITSASFVSLNLVLILKLVPGVQIPPHARTVTFHSHGPLCRQPFCMSGIT